MQREMYVVVDASGFTVDVSATSPEDAVAWFYEIYGYFYGGEATATLLAPPECLGPRK